eukprot:3775347-Pyramimonas_sp.AAC.1
MRIATGAVLSRLQVPQGQVLYGALPDVSNFFYCLVLPHWLRKYFGLPTVSTANVIAWGALPGRESSRAGLPGRVYPVMRVCPQGWSWAFWFAKRAHSHQ